jgi:hypothetical protein
MVEERAALLCRGAEGYPHETNLSCDPKLWYLITGAIRKFHEEADKDFILLRMIEIWEAEETMECHDNDSTNGKFSLDMLLQTMCSQ